MRCIEIPRFMFADFVCAFGVANKKSIRRTISGKKLSQELVLL